MLTEMKILLRQLARQRTFTLTAVATLAVGIGATTAIFSTVNATLLRPLPYPTSEDLHELRGPYVDGRPSTGRLTGAYVAGVRNGAPSVQHVIAVQDYETVLVVENGDNRQIRIQAVTDGFFDMMGLPMAAGRPFTPEEHASGGAVVLSHRLWSEVYGRDPAIVGGTVQLTIQAVPVVGVAPPELDVPAGTDAWAAFRLSDTNLSHSYESYLRVRPGTDPAVLQDELDAVMVGLIREYPQAATGRAFFATSLVSTIVGDLGTILVVVLGGAIVLLLVGSANVATLLLARGVAQTKEVAVRTALGADRWVIVRRFVAEVLLLAAAGTAAGLFLAWLGVRALSALGAAELPRLDDIPFDLPVLGFAVVTLLATTLLAGLLPALVLARPDIQGLLSETGRSNTRTRGSRRVLMGLVIAEIALAIGLVSGAGLLVRSYANLTATDLGFETAGRLVFIAQLAGTQWTPRPVIIQGPDGRPMLDPNQPPSESPRTWFAQVSERLLSLGQVEAVGSGSAWPLQGESGGVLYAAAVGAPYDPERREAATQRIVGHTFFETMGTRILAGRAFNAMEDAPVALVNEAFVRTYFPNQDPLTSSFNAGFPEINPNFAIRVVGVVEDVKWVSPSQEARTDFYVHGYGARQVVVVKTTLEDPTPLIPAVRAEVAAVDPNIPVTIELASGTVGEQFVRHQMGLILMGLFAAMSLALAAIGIYGVISNLTAQRRAELATRAAFGADPAHLRLLVMRQGATMAFAGTGGGAVLAWLGGRSVASRLFEVRAFDPAIVAPAVLAVLAITFLAFLLPALQAARRAPGDGLRVD